MTLNSLRRSFLAVSFTASLVLAACGGGGGGGGGTDGFSNFDLLLTDGPADDLLAFQATVNEAHLQILAGGETANLLAGPVVVELLGLQQSFAWLASENVPADTYTGVRLVFAPGSYDARRNDGSSVAVTSLSDEVTLDFAAPIVLTDTGYSKIELDVDMSDSLQGSISSPPITFAPQGTVKLDNSSSRIDELKGVVISVDESQSTFVLNAFVDDDSSVLLGEVLVRVTSSTLLIEDDGGTFASKSAFFAGLVANTTQLEVHGDLVTGAVTATRIEIEDNQAGGGESNLVKIEGLVIGIGPGEALEISIIEVEKGASIVAAASGGMIPDTLDVVWDGSTVFFMEEHQVTTSASLAVGQKVKVKFPTFTNPPYTASRIEIENEDAENEGTITSIAGLPTSIVVHLENTSPAVLSGQVQASSTDVTVDLVGITPFLDTENDPSIAAASLLTGLRVEIHGAVAGTPTVPTIDATRLKIKAGELDDAMVSTINEGSARFTTTGGSIDDPFGNPIELLFGTPPQTVLIASSCVFEGDASTRAQFFDLFQSLDPKQVLVVRVQGVGTGVASEIRAYEIRAEVEN